MLKIHVMKAQRGCGGRTPLDESGEIQVSADLSSDRTSRCSVSYFGGPRFMSRSGDRYLDQGLSWFSTVLCIST
jgi:hypothetical protein